jgi:hypothetical protein
MFGTGRGSDALVQVALCLFPQIELRDEQGAGMAADLSGALRRSGARLLRASS